jgi:uroporphyrinogen decarboxylase
MPNYEDLISLVRGPAPPKPIPAIWNYAPCHFGAIGGESDIHRFYFDVDYKLANQLKLAELIPDAFLLPGFFADLGVVVDASAFGGELLWLEGTAPHIHASINDLKQIDKIRPPKPGLSGLMPLQLTQYRMINQRLQKMGLPPNRYIHIMGPAEVAGLILGYDKFFMGIHQDYNRIKALMEIVTDVLIQWLELQSQAVGGAKVLCVADHACSQISPQHLEELVLPFEQAIFNAFPEPIKIYHNEGFHNDRHIGLMLKSGAEVWHFGSDVHRIAGLYEKIGDDVVLFGGLNPHGNMLNGGPDDVRAETKAVKKAAKGRRLLLSTGTGTTPEVGLINQKAMVQEALA